MNEFDDVTSRLQALGDNPVPPPVATQHLTAMAEVAAPRTRFSHKLRVAAAFGVGILVGGTGLGYAAANDSLPAPAQNAVEAAGRAVGLEIAAEKKAAKADNGGNGGDNSSTPLEETVACEEGMSHGEYVSGNVKAARQADPKVKGNARELAKSDCGKDATDEADVQEAPETEGETDADDNGGEGRAKGAAKKAENAPDEANPAGPPAEQPGNTPASVPVSDGADDSADENTPDEVPPAGTGPGWDDDSED